VRVLIADDRPATREGLKALLGHASGVEVVGEAADGLEAVQLVGRHRPDVVLLDVRMPGMNGLEALRRIKARWPEVRVVVHSMYPTYREGALAAGADAFLLKGSAAEQVRDAVRKSGGVA
jgi:DNA-binding NarL/FixJ family response regulator